MTYKKTRHPDKRRFLRIPSKSVTEIQYELRKYAFPNSMPLIIALTTGIFLETIESE